MVYELHIPSKLTDEEKLLKEKYKQLRSLRNRLNAPKEKVSPQTSVKSTVVTSKRTALEPKDAKEVAKNLLKSGAISAIKIENKDTQGFKRPKGFERKHNSFKKGNITPSDNQSFSTFDPDKQAVSFDSSNLASSSFADNHNKQNNKTYSSSKGLYERFVKRGKLEDEIKEQHVRQNKNV